MGHLWLLFLYARKLMKILWLHQCFYVILKTRLIDRRKPWNKSEIFIMLFRSQKTHLIYCLSILNILFVLFSFKKYPKRFFFASLGSKPWLDLLDGPKNHPFIFGVKQEVKLPEITANTPCNYSVITLLYFAVLST